MRRVYQAANNIEAHMIVHLLEQSGMRAHVEGEHLQSGAGELPLGNLVAVVVADDDVAAAREVIREWEARTAPATSSGDAASKSPALGQGIAFLVGALLAGGIVWSVHNGPEGMNAVDRNGDGKPDEQLFYDGDRLDRIESDRNFDGRADAFTEFDDRGYIDAFRGDDNFDGTTESAGRYRYGEPASWRIDPYAKTTTYRESWENGVPTRAEYLNSATGKVRKRVDFAAGKPDRAYLDLDEDGTWDRTYRYDAIDEPVYQD